MSKGIKKLANVALHTLSAVVLMLFLLVLVVALAFSLPRVQTFAAHRVVDWVTEEFGLNISLRGVSISGLSNVVVEDLYVEDLAGDTLLYVPRASATIDRNALLGEGVFAPSRVRVEGGWFNLHAGEDGRTNIEKLVLKVQEQLPPAKASSEPFVIRDLQARGTRFTLYNQKVYRAQRSGINYSDMDLHIDLLDIGLLTVVGEDVELRIDKLTATDKTGASLQNSSIERLIVSSEADLLFYDVQFYSGEADVRVPKVELTAAEWDDYKLYNSRVNMSIESDDSYLTHEALAMFVPDLGDVGVDVEHFDCSFDGLVDDFVVSLAGAQVEGADVKGRVRIENVVEFPNTRISVDSLSVKTTTAQAITIYEDVTKTPLNEQITPWVERFREVDLNLSGVAADNALRVSLGLATDLGSAGVDGSVEFARKGEIDFDGEVWMRGLNVGRVVDVKELGKVTLTADLKGLFAEENITGSGSVFIDRLAYGGYTYNDISLEGGYENDVARLTLRSLDRNLLCALDAECDLSWLEPQYNLNLSLEGVDFAALGMAPSDSRSWLSCNLEASAEGASLDDLVGRAMINDLVYVSTADTLSTELINVVVGGGSEGEKSFSLYSPLADVEYRSRASYEDVFAYFGGALINPLPSNNPNRKGEEQTAATDVEALYRASDYSSIHVSINTDENLLAAFVPGATIAADSSLSMEFSPSAGAFVFALDSDYVEWTDLLASRIHVGANGTSERIDLGVEVNELLALGTSVPDVVVNAYAKEGSHLGATLLFSDNTSAVSGRVQADGELWYDKGGKMQARASLADSFVMLNNHRWDLSAEAIDYNSESLAIDHFTLTSGEQRIFLDGEVAPNDRVPLRLELDGVLLGALAELAGVKEVEGCLSGRVEICSAMASPFGEGQLSLTDVSVGGVTVAPMDLRVSMPKDEGEVSLRLNNSELGSTLVSALYDLEQNTYEGRLTVRELDLAAFGSLATDVVSELSGGAVADLSVEGEGASLKIDGTLELESVEAKVALTGVTYKVPSLKVEFADNVGRIEATQVSDTHGGRATLNGGVDLADLNSLKYNIQLIPMSLAVIDLPPLRELPFYGNVTVSGAASLMSEGGDVVIDAALNTGEGSVFNLPLSGSSDFSSVDFVQFVDAESAMAPDTTDVVARKKLLMENRNRKSGRKSNVLIDAQLGVNKDTQLRLIIDEATNNVLVASGEADLSVAIDTSNSDIQIRGDYQISEGYYNFNFQNLIGKRFTISPGSYIRWNGSPMDAHIDIDAFYKVKTSLAPLLGTETSASRGSTPVECIVNLGGSLADIDLNFDINVPTANAEYQSILSSYFSSQEMMATQFVYLLAMGSFYSDGSGSGQGTAQAGATGTAIGLGLLVDQVSRLVSNDAYRFNVKYKMYDETASTYGVDFETEIIDNRLLLELEANVDTGGYYQGGAGEGNNQLTGGGALTLLLDKAGNFILKGFSRTIDRFDENQGLQENGVGIYYRRSFDRLSDLWRKKPKRVADMPEKSGTFAEPSAGASE
ncbi:MAG: translocation/assembly module TamB domain-containing protein [Tidjanibacter sp.]|nr:translocation/assembly module TamB domain-containing protein [Tidjanibacter sp.]